MTSFDKTIPHKLNPYTSQINTISVRVSRHPSTKALKILRVVHINRIFNFSGHKVDDIFGRFRSKSRQVTERQIPSYGTQPKIKQNSHLIYAIKTKQHQIHKQPETNVCMYVRVNCTYVSRTLLSKAFVERGSRNILSRGKT